VLLTLPDETPLWLEPGSLIIRKASDEQQAGCSPYAQAVIRVAGVAVCVKESPQQIIDLIDHHR